MVRYPDAVRPWQLVLEPLTGYLRLGRALLERRAEFACGWNFGPTDDEAMTVGEVATCAAQTWGDGARWSTDGGTHPHEEQWLRLDSAAAHAQLCWTPRLDAATAIAWTVGWYRDYNRQWPARELCMRQIEAYFGEAC